MCICFSLFIYFFHPTTDFPPPCMSRWASDAIIHGHSQVFIILCALTVKPPALPFCLVIQSHPTVYKTRNINQRLHHPANAEKWKHPTTNPAGKKNPTNTQFRWPHDAESLAVWNHFIPQWRREKHLWVGLWCFLSHVSIMFLSLEDLRFSYWVKKWRSVLPMII